MDISNPISDIIDLGKDLLDKFVPDPQQKAAYELQLATLQATAMQAQAATNTAEAANSSIFVAGWRPFIGWVCGVSLFTYYVPYCLVATFVWAHQVWATSALQPRPDLGIADLLGLVASMLGFGVLRSFDKKVSTSKD